VAKYKNPLLIHNALFDGLKNASNEIIIILDRFLFSVFFTKEIT